MLFEALTLIGLEKLSTIIKTQQGKNDIDEWGVYRDGNGNYRLKDNSKLVVETYNEYGERIIKYTADGTTAINIDEKESQLRKQQATSDGKKFYLYRQERSGTNPRCRYGNDEIKGDRYRSTQTDSLYVIRHIHYQNYKDKNNLFGYDYYGDYMMDMNYQIISPSDDTIKNDYSRYGDDACLIHDFIISETNAKHSKYKADDLCVPLLPSKTCNINLQNATNLNIVHEQIIRRK